MNRRSTARTSALSKSLPTHDPRAFRRRASALDRDSPSRSLLALARRALALGGLLLLAVSLAPTPATACIGPPPEPFCTKVFHLALAGPPVVLLPGGGTFDVKALVYLGFLEFPIGSGICPDGPYLVDVEVTATCDPLGADGAGEILGTAITTGYTAHDIPITVPAGPPRRCVLDATATLTLTDGMVLSETADTLACLGDPAPGDPAEPRLDLRHVGLPGEEIARVHPGDPAGFVYEIINNDPEETFTGTLTVDSLNESRLASASGPMPPGTAVISAADPVEGDNFGIDLLLVDSPLFEGEPVSEGCFALSDDPGDPAIPRDTLAIELAPLESLLVSVRSRSWGLCADGSCNRSTLDLAGAFSDTTGGRACSGFVTAGDLSRPPSFACDDSGSVVVVETTDDPYELNTRGFLSPGAIAEILARLRRVGLRADAMAAEPPTTFAGRLSVERGRIQTQFAEPFDPGATFDIDFEMELEPGLGGLPFSVDLEGIDSTGGPTGLERIAPFVVPRVALRVNPQVAPEGFIQMAIQVSAIAIDNQGDRLPLEFDGVTFDAQPNMNRISGVLTGGQVVGGGGGATGLDAIEVSFDLRGFVSPTLQGSLVFTDGFESGNVTRWSSSID